MAFESATRANQGFYHTAEWKALRSEHLLSEPYCRTCRQQGRLIHATDVDHIRPARGDYALLRNRANLQSLCKRHHNEKTGRETMQRLSRNREPEAHPGLVQ